MLIYKKNLLILWRIGEALSPTAVISAQAQDEISHLNSILMLDNSFGKRLTLEVALKYWSCKFVKIPSFGCKYPMWCAFTEKWQLR